MAKRRSSLDSRGLPWDFGESYEPSKANEIRHPCTGGHGRGRIPSGPGHSVTVFAQLGEDVASARMVVHSGDLAHKQGGLDADERLKYDISEKEARVDKAWKDSVRMRPRPRRKEPLPFGSKPYHSKKGMIRDPLHRNLEKMNYGQIEGFFNVHPLTRRPASACPAADMYPLPRPELVYSQSSRQRPATAKHPVSVTWEETQLSPFQKQKNFYKAQNNITKKERRLTPDAMQVEATHSVASWVVAVEDIYRDNLALSKKKIAMDALIVCFRIVLSEDSEEACSIELSTNPFCTIKALRSGIRLLRILGFLPIELPLEVVHCERMKVSHLSAVKDQIRDAMNALIDRRKTLDRSLPLKDSALKTALRMSNSTLRHSEANNNRAENPIPLDISQSSMGSPYVPNKEKPRRRSQDETHYDHSVDTNISSVLSKVSLSAPTTILARRNPSARSFASGIESSAEDNHLDSDTKQDGCNSPDEQVDADLAEDNLEVNLTPRSSDGQKDEINTAKDVQAEAETRDDHGLDQLDTFICDDQDLQTSAGDAGG